MRFRARRREPVKMPEITLVPLIDTALNLLIIFMVTAPMLRMTLKVDLPDARTAHSTKVEDQSIIVEMDGHAHVFFDGTSYNLSKKRGVNQTEQLKKAIAHRITQQNNSIFLYADKSLRYKKIVKLFDLLNGIEGVQHVALVTQKAV